MKFDWENKLRVPQNTESTCKWCYFRCRKSNLLEQKWVYCIGPEKLTEIISLGCSKVETLLENDVVLAS